MSDQAATKLNRYERKVRSLFLDKEMFVTRLDRPWLDTPFWLQGFMVRTDQELKALNKYCDFAYIDISRGKEAEFYMEENLILPSNDFLEVFLQKKNKPKKNKFRQQTCLKNELITAKKTLEDTTIKYVLMMQGIKKGSDLDINIVNSLIEPILDSIIRNTDAFILLSRLRNKKEYTFSHAIDACALSIAFGRHMGLPRRDLMMLSTGVLLFDIGKLKIDDSILNKAEQLTDEEFKEVNKHVDYSIDMLNKTEDVHADILNIALTHHERFDGSGYPNGLSKLKIPVYGRIASIIDCYDAMTSQRPFATQIQPYTALQQIYTWRNKFFQPELIEQFLQCMGTYPNGTLVELNSGEIAIVITQNSKQRLNPKIIPILDIKKQAYKTFEVVDLSLENIMPSGKQLAILRNSVAEDYKINTEIIYEKLASIISEEIIPQLTLAEKLGDKIEKNYVFITTAFNAFIFKIKKFLMNLR